MEWSPWYDLLSLPYFKYLPIAATMYVPAEHLAQSITISNKKHTNLGSVMMKNQQL